MIVVMYVMVGAGVGVVDLGVVVYVVWRRERRYSKAEGPTGEAQLELERPTFGGGVYA